MACIVLHSSVIFSCVKRHMKMLNGFDMLSERPSLLFEIAIDISSTVSIAAYISLCWSRGKIKDLKYLYQLCYRAAKPPNTKVSSVNIYI